MGKEVLITSEPTVKAEKFLSRREFLKGATVLGGVLLLDRVFPTPTYKLNLLMHQRFN